MKPYTDYERDDFLADASFRRWVRQGASGQADDFWTPWLAGHPQQRAHAEQARRVLLALETLEAPATPQQVEALVQRTLRSVERHRTQDARRGRPLVWMLAAAAVCGVMLLGWGLLRTQGAAPAPLADGQAVAPLLTRRNATAHLLPVDLPDGSTVLLSPASEVRYPTGFAGTTRAVYLVGQGFFEVSKDTTRPFLVYADGLVARVTGTSFTVRAVPGASHVKVMVKTGRVEVYRQQASAPAPEPAITLQPHQQAVLDLTSRRLARVALAAGELDRNTPGLPPSWNFDETPVATIFDRLEAAYGVAFQFDREQLTSCLLTTRLRDEPLAEKLALICAAVGPGTRFAFTDARVVITTQGCNQ